MNLPPVGPKTKNSLPSMSLGFSLATYFVAALVLATVEFYRTHDLELTFAGAIVWFVGASANSVGWRFRSKRVKPERAFVFRFLFAVFSILPVIAVILFIDLLRHR